MGRFGAILSDLERFKALRFVALLSDSKHFEAILSVLNRFDLERFGAPGFDQVVQLRFILLAPIFSALRSNFKNEVCVPNHPSLGPRNN